MDVFELRNRLLDDYRRYATSFMRFRDERIRTYVEEALDSGKLWPHPKIGLNPAFESGGTIDDLVAERLLHSRNRGIFRSGKSDDDRGRKTPSAVPPHGPIHDYPRGPGATAKRTSPCETSDTGCSASAIVMTRML